jgi:plasmid stability protein
MQVNLSIKGVPEALAQKLRERAARNHRSLQGELMAIIEEAASEGQGAAPLTVPARGMRRIEDIAAELRQRYPAPHADIPRGTDLIREDRDSR